MINSRHGATVIFGLLLVATSACADDRTLQPEDRQATRIVKTVADIAASMPQEGMGQLPMNWDRYIFERIEDTDKPWLGDDRLDHIRTPYATVIQGNGIVDATSRVYVGLDTDTTDMPVTLSRTPTTQGRDWLYVFMGHGGSSPHRYFVDSVVVDDSTITVFHYWPVFEEGRWFTGDRNAYEYCVLLGTIRVGSYRLQMLDTVRDSLRYSRRVDVE